MKLFLKKYLKLKLKIQYYDYLYYTLNSSIISDYKYDQLCMMLKKLEKENKFEKKLKYTNYNFKKNNFSYLPEIEHKTPMLSLLSGSSIKDFLKYDKMLKKRFFIFNDIEYFCDLKIDGLAISLIYHNGILSHAVTRGNGYSGENVTINIMTISNIPIVLSSPEIPKILDVRGEIYIKKKDFLLLNKISSLHKKKNFSNPRNIASGSLRQKDPEIARKRKLQFIAYSCNFFNSSLNLEKHDKNLFLLKKWGFSICKIFSICKTIHDVIQFYQMVTKIRLDLNYEIDGIVIKVNSKILQKKIGYVEKAPKWAYALKFFSHSVETKVIGIHFSIGRTGLITPIAFLKPVFISGVLIKKVTLYNKKKILELKLHIGDIVKIYRAGDVIPKIEKVLLKKRSITVQKIIFPYYCNICHTKIVYLEQEGLMYCPAGFFCQAQNEKRLLHFVSKNGLYMPGLGLKIIKKLLKKGCVKTPDDFYKLNIQSFEKISGIGIILTKKILNSINSSKIVMLNKFIYALGIFLVGKVVSKNLANFFGSVRNFLNSNYTILCQIEGIGHNIATSIILFLKSKENLKIIYFLKKKLCISSFFSNSFYMKDFSKIWIYQKKFVLSGKFLTMSKEKICTIIEKYGGIVKSYISKNINFLIIGLKYGQKFKQAKSLKITILSEKEFFNNLLKKNVI
ncbi:NAD-dependent DNA ligase LigA [Buchnera aphidicola]|uniref:DNA ligase n=1 Tax=Buchnera aphidicola subsp. Tuberolachnus salignus TaxID=98804 RepID=A0A160SX34_BUCTT|nr:NAD-dependent DNA ligase LigA [Buchnera aphidicola]CUR53025.1 DNA ligase [Buchnera aphidicola (Tuberolachnus salignus)]